MTILTSTIDMAEEDNRWFVLVEKGDKMAVISIDASAPKDINKAGFSIKFSENFVKIEKQDSPYKILNCYSPDGKVQERWWGGLTLDQHPRPTTNLVTK